MKVFSAIAVQSVVEELVPAFERAHGCELDLTWATAPLLQKRLQAGEMADALILNRAVTDALLALRRDRLRVRYGDRQFGHRYRGGGRRTEARHLHARGVEAKSAGGPGNLLHRSRGRRRQRHPFREAAGADGDRGRDQRQDEIPAALGLFRHVPAHAARPTSPSSRCRNCCSVPGIEIVGTLPGDLHMVTTFVASIPADSTQPVLAKAFIESLRTAEARALFRAKGLEPG